MLTETPAIPTAPPALPTGTVTFLFTDIEGSTTRWEQFPLEMRAALAQHDRLMRAGFAAHGGTVLQTAGDSFVVLFARPADALAAALDTQRALLAATWPAPLGSLRVRAALHSGTGELREDGYHAEFTLNRLARLLAAGHGGQILATATTRQLLEGDIPMLVAPQNSTLNTENSPVGGPSRPDGRAADAAPTDSRPVATQNATLQTENSVEWLDRGECWLKDLIRPLHVYQVAAPDLPRDFPPLKTLPGPGAAGPAVRQSAALDGAELENPYKGLRAFQEADAPDFFGREALVARLVSRLAEDVPLRRFLIVVGPSGSGKSSVVRAGLVPALRQGALPGSARWPVTTLVPGPRPLEELEAALLRVAPNPPASLLEQLAADERGLVRAVKRVLPEDETVELVLLVDQFEEIFTLVPDEPSRVHFLASLCAAVQDPRGRVRILATLRADFFDRPLLYPDPGELVRQRTAVVLPLSPDELERAIVRPAQCVGVTADQDLLAAILADVGAQPGTLPLLEYSLTELFERREGTRLTLAAYQASGGVLGALARRAEEIYAGLAAPEQALARQVFLRLVTLGEGVEDTRRRVRLVELETLSPDRPTLDNVLETFVRYRLLTSDRDPVHGDPTVEVAHEALLRTWPRLREWLDASREDLRVQRRLLAEAEEWVRAGRDPGLLASGTRLAQFEALATAGDITLNDTERAYLAASVAEQERRAAAEAARQAHELELARQSAEAAERAAAESQRAAAAQRSAANRLRTLLAAMALFLVIAVGLALFAFDRQGAADTQRGLAQANAATAIANRGLADANAATAVANAADAQAQHNQAQANFQRAEAGRLAAEANRLLALRGNSELIALLTVRSLNTQYSAQGDVALQGAAILDYPLKLFTGLAASTRAVAFSPDGRFLVTGAGDASATGIVQLWDVASGREVRRFTGHTALVWGVAFSPDGRFVLTGSQDGTARFWDVATGAEVHRFTASSGLRRVAFAPDGRSALVGSVDGPVYLLDTQTGAEIRPFVGHQARVLAVAFSPDGKAVLTGSSDHTARLWDAATGAELHRYAGHSSLLYSVAFSPDGRQVLTGGADQVAILWDTQSAVEIRHFTGHGGEVAAANFAPDGKTIVTASLDGTVRIWDPATGSELRRLIAHTDYVWAALYSPDGKYIASASDDGTMRLWAADEQPSLPVFRGHSAPLNVAVLSPDGRYVLTGSWDHTAALWDARTGAQLRRLTGHNDTVAIGVFSPDSRYALTGSLDGTARLWDAATGDALGVFTATQGTVNHLAFSPDGNFILASGNTTGEPMWLWDTHTGAQVRTFDGGGGPVALSLDGKLVLGTASAGLRLWDAQTGRILRTFPGDSVPVPDLAFAPDGRTLVLAREDGTPLLLDARTGQEVRRFRGHTQAVGYVHFSSDGRQLLTIGADGSARLWDVASGKELRRFAPAAGLGDATFSPDGTFVLIAGGDGVARMAYANIDDAVHDLCSRLLRDFSADERAAYNIADSSPTCPAR